MIRRLYQLLLRLHPAPFRRRFSEEMLWIFDQEAGFRRGWLLRDAGLSIGRQWLSRLGARRRQPAPGVAGQGAPIFYTFEDSGPKAGALVHGAWLSAAAFALAAVLIAHGGPSGTVKLPMVMIAPEEVAPDEISATTPELTDDVDRPAALPQPSQRPAPASPLRGPAQPGQVITPLPPAVLILSLLDRDRDGRISEAERAADASEPFRELLDRADRNADGVVTLEELEAAAPSLR